MDGGVQLDFRDLLHADAIVLGAAAMELDLRCAFSAVGMARLSMPKACIEPLQSVT